MPKNCWPRVLGSVVIQHYAGECTPNIDWANSDKQFNLPDFSYCCNVA